MVLKKPLRLRNRLRKTKTNYNLYSVAYKTPIRILSGFFVLYNIVEIMPRLRLWY